MGSDSTTISSDWPTLIVIGLNRNLPEHYVAEPQIHLGPSIEIGVATLAVVSDLPSMDQYEVRVYDTRSGRRLVAAVEIVSPAKQGPTRAPSRFRRQVRCLAPEPCLRCDHRSRHDMYCQPVWRPVGTPRPDRPILGQWAFPALRRLLPLGEDRRRLAPGNMDASPGTRPVVAHAAALARRGPRRPVGAGTQSLSDYSLLP